MKSNLRNPRQILRYFGLLALGLAAVSASGTVGGQTEDLSAWTVTDHEMTINGTSTLHDWESQVTKVVASGKIEVLNGEFQGVSRLAVEISVSGIVSPYDLMDRLTYRALKEPEHPNILYRLTKLTRLEDNRWRSIGELTIAGSTLPLEMEVEITPDDGRALSVSGTTSLKMTDFGVKPPKLMLGAVKVGDAIRIDFSVTLKPTVSQPMNDETQVD